MRPGQSSPGKPSVGLTFWRDGASFNEAGAIKPRKTNERMAEAARIAGFNEAGAIKPRKTDDYAFYSDGELALQ